MFPYVEKLRGFRSVDNTEQNLSELRGRHWDAVVDAWPFEPSMIASAAELLRDRTGHYLYISSGAAYDPKDFAAPGIQIPLALGYGIEEAGRRDSS